MKSPSRSGRRLALVGIGIRLISRRRRCGRQPTASARTRPGRGPLAGQRAEARHRPPQHVLLTFGAAAGELGGPRGGRRAPRRADSRRPNPMPASAAVMSASSPGAAEGVAGGSVSLPCRASTIFCAVLLPKPGDLHQARQIVALQRQHQIGDVDSRQYCGLPAAVPTPADAQQVQEQVALRLRSKIRTASSGRRDGTA